MDTLIRRREMMSQHKLEWNEYPVECWGIGNIEGNHSWGSYGNIVYGCFPILSYSILIENNSSYHCKLSFYTGDDYAGWVMDIDATNSGVYAIPNNALYFCATLWDRPSMSVVDSGQFKMYYKGQPYQKPVDSNIMTGSDYLWAVGNFSSFGGLDGYPNRIVRVPRTPLTRTMDIDLTNCSYNLKLNWFTSDLSAIWYPPEYRSGNLYTDILAGNNTAMYYTVTLWDKPTFAYARQATFRIIFR